MRFRAWACTSLKISLPKLSMLNLKPRNRKAAKLAHPRPEVFQLTALTTQLWNLVS